MRTMLTLILSSLFLTTAFSLECQKCQKYNFDSLSDMMKKVMRQNLSKSN